MTEKMSAVLIGCGRWGRVLLKSALNIGIEIVGLIDTDELQLSKSVKTLKTYSAHRLTTATTLDMLKTIESKVDAVIIATPPSTHAEMTRWCLDRGLHVYCEKPLALGLEEFLSIEIPQGLVLQGGYQYAYMPVIGDLYVVDTGLVNISGIWHNDGPVRKSVGGSLNTLVHPASMMVSLFWDDWIGVVEVADRWVALPGQPQAGICSVMGIIETSIGKVSYLFDTSWMAKQKRREFRVSTARNEFVFDDVAKTLVIHDTPDMSNSETYHWQKTPVEEALHEFYMAVVCGGASTFDEPEFTRRIFECLNL